jgi:hypothetical protein
MTVRTSEADRLRARVREHLAEQRALVASLLRLREQVAGSLFVRYGQCGKAGCACREGRGHGPYYVLSHRRRGRATFDYLDPAGARAARRGLLRYRRFRQGLRRLQRLNVALVELLRRYQEAQDRAGRRRERVRRKTGGAATR